MFKKIFEQNKILEISIISVGIILFYFYYTNVPKYSLYEFLLIRDVEGSSINFFLVNIYWFTFFWIVTTIPLNYFFNELANIPLLEEIRKSNKKKYIFKIFIQILSYVVVYTTIFSFIELYFNPTKMLLIFMLSIILVVSIYLILLAGLLTELIFGHFVGILMQSLIIIFVMFNKNILIIPRQVLDIHKNIIVGILDILIIFFIHILIVKLFLKKELI
ncbi:hypothetical protein [Vagococcus fluvialis]|uniref:hypothetical protein n=1 Tax=Vagococcus fluvialis TaxID=2738 RepID=UPI0037AE80CC